MTKKIYQYLESEGFEKKWCDDKSGFWYEKLFQTFFGKIEVVVEDRGVWVRMLGLADGTVNDRFEVKSVDRMKGILDAINLIPKEL